MKVKEFVEKIIAENKQNWIIPKNSSIVDCKAFWGILVSRYERNLWSDFKLIYKREDAFDSYQRFMPKVNNLDDLKLEKFKTNEKGKVILKGSIEKVYCPECDGHGEIECPQCDATKIEKCYVCKGKGEVVESFQERKTIEKWICSNCDWGWVNCNTCWGQWKQRWPCKTCNWQGRIYKPTKEMCQYCSWSWREGNNICRVCRWARMIMKTEQVLCNVCNWSGNNESTCYTCRGTWKRKCSMCMGNWVLKEQIIENKENRKPCSNCWWRGEYTCRKCQGSGNLTCPLCYGERELISFKEGQLDLDVQAEKYVFVPEEFDIKGYGMKKLNTFNKKVPVNEQVLKRAKRFILKNWGVEENSQIAPFLWIQVKIKSKNKSYIIYFVWKELFYKELPWFKNKLKKVFENIEVLKYNLRKYLLFGKKNKS